MHTIYFRKSVCYYLEGLSFRMSLSDIWCDLLNSILHSINSWLSHPKCIKLFVTCWFISSKCYEREFVNPVLKNYETFDNNWMFNKSPTNKAKYHMPFIPCRQRSWMLIGVSGNGTVKQTWKNKQRLHVQFAIQNKSTLNKIASSLD